MSVALMKGSETENSPTEAAPVISTLTVEGRGAGDYEVRLLKEPGSSWLNPEKVQELWMASREHSVLFSDYTQGKVKPFLRVLAAPNSVWFEVFDLGKETPVGLLYLSRIIPKFDGYGHFAFWDSIAHGREPLVLDTIEYIFDKYDLARVTAEVPVYQKGTIRFIERLGFTLEGERRNGVIYKGSWMNQKIYGMLKEEMEGNHG